MGRCEATSKEEENDLTMNLTLHSSARNTAITSSRVSHVEYITYCL